MKDPKHCPFCGSTKILCQQIEEDSFMLECQFCFACGPETMTEEQAERRWNTRYKENNP